MTVQRRQVELLEKNRPRQERAKRTYESILTAAAELLVEVGVERISTNLIAERAGITVPALYRYFPNKYAVINALGAAMMDRQNQVFQRWVETHSSDSGVGVLDHVYELLWMTYEVTLEQTGGLEVLQSLRAVGPLQELRLTSHRLVADEISMMLADLLQQPVSEELAIQARLSVEIGYGVVEMALEDSSLPPEESLRQGARLLEQYWRSLIQP